jgi:hypothetical protein
MPDTFFRQVVDDNGTRYEPVEVIPDEVVYTHEAYRKVVDESVGRRKTIAELKAENEALKAASTPATPPEPAPVQQPPAPAPEPVKVPTFDEFYAQWQEKHKQELSAAEQQSQQLNALLTEHGLDASYIPLLENAKDPVKAAAELGRKKLSFAEGGVNPAQQANPSDMFSRINKNLNLK